MIVPIWYYIKNTFRSDAVPFAWKYYCCYVVIYGFLQYYLIGSSLIFILK